MKIKKFGKILFYIAFGTMILSLGVFLLAPFVAGKDFSYNGFEVFKNGFVALFSFKFSETPVVLFFFLFLFSMICLLIWLVQLMKFKAKKGSFFKFGLMVLSMLVIFSLASSMFSVKITFNDKLVTLYDGLCSLSSNVIANVLIMLSISFAYLSLMANTLYVFFHIGMINLYGKDFEELELPAGGLK